MANSLSAQELAHAAAQGVAIALTAQAHQAAGAKGEHTEAAFQIPNRLIFGGPFRPDLFEVKFTQHGGIVQASSPVQVKEI